MSVSPEILRLRHAGFTDEQAERLIDLKSRVVEGRYNNDIGGETETERRRKEFAKWLVEHGRLDDQDASLSQSTVQSEAQRLIAQFGIAIEFLSDHVDPQSEENGFYMDVNSNRYHVVIPKNNIQMLVAREDLTKPIDTNNSAQWEEMLLVTVKNQAHEICYVNPAALTKDHKFKGQQKTNTTKALAGAKRLLQGLQQTAHSVARSF